MGQKKKKKKEGIWGRIFPFQQRVISRPLKNKITE
jgi:hypothetical protein